MGVPAIALLLFQAFPGSNDSGRAAARSTAYEELVRNNPSDPTLYADYASFLIANHEYSSALAWIKKGLAAAPSDPALHLREGIALHAINRPEESLRILERLPASGESRFYMGLDYRALGDHASAQKYLAEA